MDQRSVDLYNEKAKSLKLGKASMQIWNTKETMKDLWEIKDVKIIMDDPMQTFHCTIIRRKKNKVLAGRKFELIDCPKDQAPRRIKAWYIMSGLFGEIDGKVYNYLEKVYKGEQIHDKRFDTFFDWFDQLYRIII